jgi:hypothetical protein
VRSVIAGAIIRDAAARAAGRGGVVAVVIRRVPQLRRRLPSAANGVKRRLGTVSASRTGTERVAPS